MSKKRSPLGQYRQSDFGTTLPFTGGPGANIKHGGIIIKFWESVMSDPKGWQITLNASFVDYKAQQTKMMKEAVRRHAEPTRLEVFDGPQCPPGIPHCTNLEQLQIEDMTKEIEKEGAKLQASKKEHPDGTPEA